MDVQIVNFLNILKCAIHGGAPKLNEPNWNTLFGYARIHSVIPLFYEGLSKTELPPDLEMRLMTTAFGLVGMQAARTEAFLEVYDKLLENGLEPIVLKGLICRQTYGELGDHRPSGDEDIWIKKEAFYRCKQVLEENGFVQEKIDVPDSELDSFQEITFENAATKVSIEVHLNLTGGENKARAKINKYFKNAMEEKREASINGHKVYTLSHTKHFIYLFLHFYKHITIAGAGIRQIMDIMMYRRAYENEIDFKEVKRAVAEFSAQKLFADITYIANAYLGFEPEPYIKPSYPDRLLEDIMEGGAFGNSNQERFNSGHVLLASEGAENAGQMVFKALFPSAQQLKQGYPILMKLPWLLPFVWIYRLVSFPLRNKRRGARLNVESFAIAKRRRKMLRDYGLEK